LFKINTDGTGYQILHNFTGANDDGHSPDFGNLVLSGSTLCGATKYGGSSSNGVLFKIAIDGTGFQLLHSFDHDEAANGSNPEGSLVVVGPTLYGVTVNSGAGGDGTVFQIESDGSAYTNLHNFTNGTTDGGNPYGSVVLLGSTLYGMTHGGGSSNKGVIFSLALPTMYWTWQLQYFGCTNCPQAEASADPDGDGQDNDAEFLAGTVPTNSPTYFHIVSADPVGSNVVVTWACGAGRTNVLEAADDPGGGYSNISPNIIIAGTGESTTNHPDVGGLTNALMRFYRVRLVGE